MFFCGFGCGCGCDCGGGGDGGGGGNQSDCAGDSVVGGCRGVGCCGCDVDDRGSVGHGSREDFDGCGGGGDDVGSGCVVGFSQVKAAFTNKF